MRIIGRWSRAAESSELASGIPEVLQLSERSSRKGVGPPRGSRRISPLGCSTNRRSDHLHSRAGGLEVETTAIWTKFRCDQAVQFVFVYRHALHPEPANNFRSDRVGYWSLFRTVGLTTHRLQDFTLRLTSVKQQAVRRCRPSDRGWHGAEHHCCLERSQGDVVGRRVDCVPPVVGRTVQSGGG